MSTEGRVTEVPQSTITDLRIPENEEFKGLHRTPAYIQFHVSLNISNRLSPGGVAEQHTALQISSYLARAANEEDANARVKDDLVLTPTAMYFEGDGEVIPYVLASAPEITPYYHHLLTQYESGKFNNDFLKRLFIFANTKFYQSLPTLP